MKVNAKLSAVLAFVITAQSVAPAFAESKLYDTSSSDNTNSTAVGLAVGVGAVAAIGTPVIGAVTTLVAPAIAPALIVPAIAALPATVTITAGAAEAASIISIANGGVAFNAGTFVAGSAEASAIQGAASISMNAMDPLWKTIQHGITENAAVPGSDAIYSSGSQAVYRTVGQAQPDKLLGISTVTLIQGLAASWVATIAFDMITGKHQNPTGTHVLVCDGFKAPSGKSYRFSKRVAKFDQCKEKSAVTPVVNPISIDRKTKVVKPSKVTAPQFLAPPAVAPKFLAPPAVKNLPAKG
jgi:hypothetical protein